MIVAFISSLLYPSIFRPVSLAVFFLNTTVQYIQLKTFPIFVNVNKVVLLYFAICFLFHQNNEEYWFLWNNLCATGVVFVIFGFFVLPSRGQVTWHHSRLLGCFVKGCQSETGVSQI